VYTFWVRSGEAGGEVLVRVGHPRECACRHPQCFRAAEEVAADAAAVAAVRGARRLGLTRAPEQFLVARPAVEGQVEGLFEVSQITWGRPRPVGTVEVLAPFADSEEGE